MTKQILLTMVVSALLLTGAAAAQDEPAMKESGDGKPITPAELEAKVDAYIAPYLETGNFSGTILIARGNEILLDKGYGFANYDYRIPAEADTRYPLGSIGKQITAAAIMQLVDEGKLWLDDKLKKFLPKYRYGDRITIHNLLSHTSGVPELPDTSAYFERRGADISTREQRIEQLNKQKLEFRPGSSYKYTNINFWLLTEVVMEVTGQSHDKYIREHVFVPAGMDQTVIDRGQAISKRADGHYFAHSGLIKSYYFERATAGAIFTTARDLFRFTRGILDATLVSAESRDKMFTRHNDVYGYAYFISQTPKGKVVWHGGNSIGYKANVLHHFATGITLVIFSNIFDTPFEKIVGDLLNLGAGNDVETPRAYHAVEIDMDNVKRLLGTYRDEENSLVSMVLENDNLFLEITSTSNALGTRLRRRMVLFPMAEDRFFLVDMPVEVYFPQGKDRGRVTHMHFINDGQVTELERVDDRRYDYGPPTRQGDDDPTGPPDISPME